MRLTKLNKDNMAVFFGPRKPTPCYRANVELTKLPLILGIWGLILMLICGIGLFDLFAATIGW